MGYKGFDLRSSGLMLLFLLSGSLLFLCCESSFEVYYLGLGMNFGGFFIFDVISFYLCILSLFLLISLLPMVHSVSFFSKGLILLSVFTSMLSYCCSHVLGFWMFYEVSILSLLVLLMLESPYSERFIAAWYLVGYVVLTSLPMLLCLFFLVSFTGSFNILNWGGLMEGCEGVLILLSILFMTKMPLPPFHVWLPIVHAEATSVVSVCLSGYMMKLGILGVCRFCFFILSDFIFSEAYLALCLVGGTLFFFSACRELDGKRWLAFMSLSHILIACLCLFSKGLEGYGLTFLYCMGHGFSAGVMFMLLWVFYEAVGSRNWGILKQALPISLVFRGLLGACLCTAASLPPTVQFFCEVSVLSEAGGLSGLFVMLLFFFFFWGGLVPLGLLGTLLSRHYSMGFGASHLFGKLTSMLFLVMWSFIMFILC